MLGIVVSRADSASEHIGEHLLSLADWAEAEDETRADADGGGTVYRRPDAELRTFEELHLDIKRAEAAFEADLDCLVFASRHAGETGALLTAHFTGNFGPADHGGEPNRFARAAPNAQKRVVEALDAHAPEGYDVGIECTHHGPSDLSVPSMFVELGSGEAQWDDPAGAAAVARAILDITEVVADAETDGEGTSEGDTHRQVVGFGGGHYAPRFERVVRETAWAVGHIGADWGLDAMGAPSANREVIERVFDASAAEYALLEADRPDLREVVEDLGYRAVSETWVREVDDVPLALVEALESALSTVDEGLRLGARAADTRERVPDGDPVDAFEVVSLPDDLLETTQGIDAEAVRAAIERETVAFETIQGGSRARGRAAVVNEADRETLVEALMAVLGEAYDSVEREDGTVVARRAAFDPEKARTLGVSEGPAFGKLSAGQSVEVAGREIDPEAVRSEQVERFDG